MAEPPETSFVKSSALDNYHYQYFNLVVEIACFGFKRVRNYDYVLLVHQYGLYCFFINTTLKKIYGSISHVLSGERQT